MSYWDYGYRNFPKAAPRPNAVKGKERKKFGITWWGRKWIELVESKGADQRMARGRAYARAERVFGIKLEIGSIVAKVEGSLGNYSVRVKFRTLDEKRWAKIIEDIRDSPATLGTILNNEMPQDMKEVCGLDPVPENFESKCSCPDYANPCKHIAALYYVLADEIDKAPQILFKLQGIEPETLFAGLSGVMVKAPKVKNKIIKKKRSVKSGKLHKVTKTKKPKKRK